MEEGRGINEYTRIQTHGFTERTSNKNINFLKCIIYIHLFQEIVHSLERIVHNILHDFVGF